MHNADTVSLMKHFTRCPGCGAVNDADAAHCYLCRSSPLLHGCPSCGAPFRNPLDTHCRSCSSLYVRTDTAGNDAPDSPRTTDANFGNHYLAHDSDPL
jgi:hypothetical protein